MAKEVPIPDELKILLPELSKGVILVGAKAYEMFPLYEGQLELISGDIATVMEKVNPPDGRCPKCGKVVMGALPKQIFKCPDDGEDLLTMRQAPMETIIKSGKIPEWVEMITGVPRAETQANMTLSQMKHFAGLFWKQNFTDDALPEESKENFKHLLEMIEPRKKEPTPAEKTTGSPSQAPPA